MPTATLGAATASLIAGLGAPATAAAVGTATAGLTASAGLTALGLGASTVPALAGLAGTTGIAAAPIAGTGLLATVGGAAGALEGVGSLATGIAGIDSASAASRAAKKANTQPLAMPDPNDPALLNSQRTQLALIQGRSGRASTNLSGGNYQATTAGGG